MPDLRTVLLNFLEDNIPFMLYYIKKYPFSLLIILAVIYLSFFKPPSTRLSLIPNIDKVVHVCMYLGMSGMLWLEFIRAHKRRRADVARLDRCIPVSRSVQWSGGVVAAVLYHLPRGRLARFCSQFHRCRIGFAGRVVALYPCQAEVVTAHPPRYSA